ncbi:hypothetical protein PFISCL1PPCAC_20013 [Pristionchus fissidentatus]|uniref:Uncharacterized protein n=1 Tax=Pristionchus fissidentatus TaxID=1538716 RepID=A0AAV5WCY1_9BILA|nr:hypothetical protein PFISCL1PPCAC_20013 [Pristionchus fissidentatus]
MGSCLCKKKPKPREDLDNRSWRNGRNQQHIRERNDGSNGQTRRQTDRDFILHDPAADVNQLIMETLSVIRDLVNNDQEPPGSLLKLNLIADKEEGWQLVVRCLIETVPHEDALGPAVITLFLDESPLPAREGVSRLLFRLDLSNSPFHSHSWGWHRNVCIVLGSLAEKMAGATRSSISTESTIRYLLDNLNCNRPSEVILFSLIALEKFAQTTENRLTILRLLNQLEPNSLEILERWLEDPVLMSNPVKMQVAFCAQWTLDNIFVGETRTYSCMVTDVSGINAMLNHADVSEYLKIGPDGLNARCDVSSFESVRCTFEVPQERSEVWYYEATVLTAGVMQIGFATKKSRFLNHEGYGIGDDEYSIAYDGCRKLIWHAAKGHKHDQRAWRAGDTIGCLLDLRKRRIGFSLNGIDISDCSQPFFSGLSQHDGIFAAASFMSFQQCIFNFGASPFRHSPSISFISFNEGGARLTQEEKTILPRRRRVELLSREPVIEDACTICCSQRADTVTKPCMHGGLCHTCSLQVEVCPFCRVPVELRVPASCVMDGGNIISHSTV